MENTEFNQIVVLKVRDMCCTAYQKKLRKKLSKLGGVLLVSMNPDKSLVSIKGKVDTGLLLKTVEKLGKYAEIVYYNKNPNNSEYTHVGEFKHGLNAEEKVEEEKGKHKCEAYIPPPFDERLCRDFYGEDPRMGPIFRDNVPASSGYSGYHPPSVNLPNYPSHSYGASQWFPSGPPVSSYGAPQWFPVGPPVSSYAARPMPGYNYYGWPMM